MRLTFDQRLLGSTYLQLLVISSTVLGALLLALNVFVSPFIPIETFLLPSTTFSIVLLGSGLIFIVKGWTHAVRLCGLCLITLSCTSLAAAWGLIHNLPVTLRLYPIIAAFFLFGGICLALGYRSKYRLWLWRTNACVWFLVAGILVIGHWHLPVSYFLGTNSSATTLTSAYILLFSPCLFLITVFNVSTLHYLSRRTVLYAVATIAFTTLTWYVLSLQHQASNRSSSAHTLENVERNIQLTVLEHTRLIARLVDGWSQVFSEASDLSDRGMSRIAQLFVQDVPSIEFIGIIHGADQRVSMLAERGGHRLEEFNGLPVTWERQRFDAQGAVDVFIDTGDGKARLLHQFALGNDDATLVVETRFDELLAQNILLDTAPFAIPTYWQGIEIYHLGEDDHFYQHSRIIGERSFELIDGIQLDLKSLHSDPTAASFLPNFLILLILYGAVLSVIMATSIELSMLYKDRARNVAKNASRQKAMRHIQEMILNHDPLPQILRAISALIDKTAVGYHSCLWLLDDKSKTLRYLASSELSGTIQKQLMRKTIAVEALQAHHRYSANQLIEGSLAFPPETDKQNSFAGYSHCCYMPIQHTNGSLYGAMELYCTEASEAAAIKNLHADVVAEILPLITMAIERHKDREILMYTARHDALTGLANRNALEARLTEWFSLDSASSVSACLLFIDLDGFKPINDGLGHAIGDRVLMEVAARLTALFRSEDLIVRFGGDEFVIFLVESLDQTIVQTLVDRVLVSVSDAYTIADLEVSVTASIGVAYVDDRANLTSPMELVQQADLAMYDAKKRGKNNAFWFSDVYQRDARYQVTLRNDIQKALANNEFELHYQPVILNSGVINGFEALLRWNHPIHGRVSPDEFIPLAEETGQIIPLSEWVINQACSDAAQLRFKENVRVGVNISPLHFYRADFMSSLMEMLSRHHLGPEAFVLELTERTLMDEHGTMINTLKNLKDAGFRLAIDDFGTGYSSLSFIKHLPITSIKIDKSFVADICHSELDANMAHAIIDMAHHLGLGVVAEGVETQEQLVKLREWGCDSLQGYFISHPANLESTLAFIRNWHGF